MRAKVLIRWMAALLAASVVIAGCSSGSSEESDPPPVDQPSEIETETTDESEVEAAGHRYVQDLWIYERLSTINPDGEEVDLTEAVVDGVQGSADREVELTNGVTFHVYDSLLARIVDAHGDERGDLDVVAGLIEYEGDQALSVLATPTAEADASVRFGDQVVVDVTYLGEQLQPGDPVISDFAFVQSLPHEDDETHAALTGLELLAARMAIEQVNYFGEEVDGESHVLLYSSQLGEAVEGSTTVHTPAKARDMKNGMTKGLNRCGLGLRCVAKFLRSFHKGATSSYDQAWANSGPTPSPPTRHPSCTGSYCARSWGEPHVTTFDGFDYDMQAVGEFIAMSSNDIEVQSRTQPFRDSDRISMGTAVAVGIDEHRVTVNIDADRDEIIRIDGDAVSLDDLRKESRSLGEATLNVVGDTLQVDLGDDRVTIANLEEREFIDLYLDFDSNDLVTEGLLGNANGDPTDDFTTRDGEVLDQPLSHDELYGTFVESWRITQDESLFDYETGTDTETYTDTSMPAATMTVADLNGRDRTRAEAVCRAAGIENEAVLESCVFDYAITGDVRFVRSAQTAEVDQMIADGDLDPTNMPVGGQRGDSDEVTAELTVAPYEPGPNEIAWLFTTSDGAPEHVPTGIQATPIQNPQDVGIFQFTDEYGYPTDPILRVGPLSGASHREAAIELGSFVEFQLTPTDGPVDISGIQLAVGRGRSDETVRGIDLRSSADGYSSSLLATTLEVTRPDMERFSTRVSGLQLTETTTFRLYFYASIPSNTVEIGDIAITVG